MLVAAADAERLRAAAIRLPIYGASHERLRHCLSAKLGDERARHTEQIGHALASHTLPDRIEAVLREVYADADAVVSLRREYVLKNIQMPRALNQRR